MGSGSLNLKSTYDKRFHIFKIKLKINYTLFNGGSAMAPKKEILQIIFSDFLFTKGNCFQVIGMCNKQDQNNTRSDI